MTNRIKTPLLLLTLTGCSFKISAQVVQFTINVDNGRKPISADIYGTNAYEAASFNQLNHTVARFGGNRSSTYNWETNWSNAGSDYVHHSDNWWIGAVGINPSWETVAGSVLQAQIDSARKVKRASMITLPAMGYVAADKNGSVSCTAPCNRWVKTYANKPGYNYSYPPSLTDNTVYLDESVNWLVNKYGKADKGGVKYYEIDNEPELWNHTHSYVRPSLITPAQLAEINETYGKMIRRLDPSAKIMGFVGFGWWGLVTVDLKTYLKEMKTRSAVYGSPLIDIFDWHFYPNDLQNFTSNKEWDLLQAPRVLWDANYYIAGATGPMGYYGQAPQLIRRYKKMINEEFPSLSMGITEWNTSYDETKVASGLYVADILGVFGQEDVEVATYFVKPTSYAATAFKLYRNYDGKFSTYGDTYVEALTSNLPNATVYAATESASQDNKLHVVVISKNMNGATSGSFTINSKKVYDKADVYYFDPTSTEIKKGADVKNISGNTFSYTIPLHSAVHFVLSSNVVTSLEDEKAGVDDISTYPQPFSNGFTIKTDNPCAYYTLLSTQGAVIEKGEYVEGKSIGTDLKSGTYILKMETDKVVRIRKIVKQ